MMSSSSSVSAFSSASRSPHSDPLDPVSVARYTDPVDWILDWQELRLSFSSLMAKE